MLLLCRIHTDKNILIQMKQSSGVQPHSSKETINRTSWHITDEITRRRVLNNKMQESTLDQIFTSDSDIIKQFTLGPPLRGSDHLTATLEVKLYDNVEYLVSKKFNLAKCDVPRLISKGRQIDRSYSEETLHCVDIMCSDLESKILHAIHQSVPISV